MIPVKRKEVVSEWEESISFDADDPDFEISVNDADEDDVDCIPELSTLRIVAENVDVQLHCPRYRGKFACYYYIDDRDYRSNCRDIKQLPIRSSNFNKVDSISRAKKKIRER